MNSTLGRLGHVLGTGLTAGLNQLAQNKIDERLRSDNELLRKKEIKSAADYLIARGLSENDAYAAASIEDKDIRKKVFEDINKISFGRDEPQQANPMQAMTGLGEPQAQQPQVAPQQQASPQQAAPEAAPQPAEAAQPSGGKSLGRIFTIGKASGQNGQVVDKQEEKENRATLNSFLKKSNAKYEAHEELGKLAEETLDYLKKHKKDLPKFPFNLIPADYQNNKHFSTLKANYEKIVGKVAAASAAGTGFRSGKALLELGRNQKSAVEQPYETQEELLQGLIDDRAEERKERKRLERHKAKNGGEYPHDLENILIEEDLKSQLLEELPDPSQVDIGAEIVDEDTGETLVNDGKRWIKKSEYEANNKNKGV